MKKIAFFLLLLVSFNFTQAQTPSVNQNEPAAATADPNAADIKFNKTTHDYGTFMQGGNGDCEFTFTNTGKSPLIISNCQGSCGCTVPSCPKDPILPGKAGVIKVHYDSNRVGAIHKTVAVNSNAKSGTTTLTIVGTIEPKPKDDEFPVKAAPKKSAAPFEKN